MRKAYPPTSDDTMFQINIVGWWGAYPGPGEATSGYLLQSDGVNILLDCGSGVLGQLQKHLTLDKIDAVVLSHYHADHVADLHCLQYASRVLMALGKRKRPLVAYGHKEDDHFSDLSYLEYCEGRGIGPNSPLHLGDLVFTFWPNIHPDPCYSMRVENKGRVLTYISDTEWTDVLVDAARDADLLICESSLYNQYKGAVPGHLTAGEAGQIAKQANVGKLVLSHLPHFGNHQDLAKEAAEVFHGPIELARTGRILTI